MPDKPVQNISVNPNGTLHIANQGPTALDGSWGRVSYDLNNNGEILKQHVTGNSPANVKFIQNVPVLNQNMGDVIANLFNLPKP